MDGRRLTEEDVFAVVEAMARRSDGLMTFGDLCFVLGASRDSVQATLRALEARGLVVCTTKEGPINALAPVALRAGAARGVGANAKPAVLPGA